MREPPGIIQVSDISVGYGNYDSLTLVQSIRKHYGLPALVLEPDQWDKPLQTDIGGVEIKRLATSTYFRSVTGRIEFVIQAAEIINALRPKVLIIRCSWNVPVLLKLLRKPPLVIYHSTESTLYYGNTDPAMNRAASPLMDIVIFPEENRAARDLERCGLRHLPVAIAYNCAISHEDAAKAEGETKRNGRILYSGALDCNATYVSYYADQRMSGIPIDLYGYIGGSDAGKTREILDSLQGSARYQGYVETEVLEKARPSYAYSITIWNPSNENQRFACPCKFFESIASLVPPIAAPHPQCKLLIERYRCGVLMDDWSFDSFFSAIRKALMLYGTAEYDDMVGRCKVALMDELNWDHQFQNIERLLPKTV